MSLFISHQSAVVVVVFVAVAECSEYRVRLDFFSAWTDARLELCGNLWRQHQHHPDDDYCLKYVSSQYLLAARATHEGVCTWNGVRQAVDNKLLPTFRFAGIKPGQYLHQ